MIINGCCQKKTNEQTSCAPDESYTSPSIKYSSPLPQIKLIKPPDLNTNTEENILGSVFNDMMGKVVETMYFFNK